MFNYNYDTEYQCLNCIMNEACYRFKKFIHKHSSFLIIQIAYIASRQLQNPPKTPKFSPNIHKARHISPNLKPNTNSTEIREKIAKNIVSGQKPTFFLYLYIKKCIFFKKVLKKKWVFGHEARKPAWLSQKTVATFEKKVASCPLFLANF